MDIQARVCPGWAVQLSRKPADAGAHAVHVAGI